MIHVVERGEGAWRYGFLEEKQANGLSYTEAPLEKHIGGVNYSVNSPGQCPWKTCKGTCKYYKKGIVYEA